MRDSQAEGHLAAPPPQGHTPVSSTAAAAPPKTTCVSRATPGCDDTGPSHAQRGGGGGEVMSRISKLPRRGQAGNALHRQPARQDRCGSQGRREPLLGLGFGVQGWWTRESAGTSVSRRRHTLGCGRKETSHRLGLKWLYY